MKKYRGALRALHETKNSGKVMSIGISGHIPSVLTDAINRGSFESVQVPYNIIEI